MSKITAEMWGMAEATVFHARLRYYDMGNVELFTIACNLYDRYNDGERSIELYSAIMELC